MDSSVIPSSVGRIYFAQKLPEPAVEVHAEEGDGDNGHVEKEILPKKKGIVSKMWKTMPKKRAIQMANGQELRLFWVERLKKRALPPCHAGHITSSRRKLYAIAYRNSAP